MNSGSKVILAALAGAAAGMICGVLFAPDKGEETRRKISRKSSDIADSLKGKFNDLVDGIASKFESVKGEAADLGQQVKERANSMKADVRNTM